MNKKKLACGHSTSCHFSMAEIKFTKGTADVEFREEPTYIYPFIIGIYIHRSHKAVKVWKRKKIRLASKIKSNATFIYQSMGTK